MAEMIQSRAYDEPVIATALHLIIALR